MLQEIFELHRFDLTSPTKRLIEENDHAVSRLEGSLQEVPEIEENELKELEEERVEKRETLAKLEVRLGQMEKQEAELKQLKEIKDNLAEVRETLDFLEPSEADFKDKEKRLKLYNIVLGAFGEPLNRKKLSKERQGIIQKEQEAREAQKEPLQQEIVGLEKRYEAAFESYEEREVLRTKASEIETISEMVRVNREQSQLAERLEKGNNLVVEHQGKKEELKTQIVELEGILKSQRDELPDAELLSSLRSWFEQLKFREEALVEAQTELEKVTERGEGEKQELINWLTQPLVQSIASESSRSLESLEENLQKEMHEQEELMEGFLRQSQELQLQKGLSSYAEALKSGQPCPLCGAIDHPAPFHREDAAHQLEDLERRITAMKGRLRQLNDLKPELKTWLLRDIQQRDRVAQANALISTRVQALELHKGAFEWEGFNPNDPAGIDSLVNKEKLIREQLSEGEKKLRSLREESDQKQHEIERYQTALNDMVVRASTHKARFETLSASLKNYSYPDFREKTREEMEILAWELRDRYEKVTTEFKAAKMILEEQRGAYQTLEKNLEFGARELKRLSTELKRLDAELVQKLEANQLRDLEEVEEILQWELDSASEEDKIREFRQLLERARTEWVTYKKQEAGREYDPGVHAKVAEELEGGKVQRSRLEQELAGLQFRIKDVRGKIEKRKTLLAELEKLQLRADNLKVLESLFRGSGFVNYVSTIYLRELCQRANIRFQQLTRHQMSLEIDEKNDFQVRDNLNGGRMRSVRTLSGGQTFQASLCLALALADNITNRIGSSQNFFFLDEGFGTLDRESLSLVFETLKQLRKENRIVGVISHVEELQQEIDQSLLIRKDEERGSLVKGSWE